MEMEKMKKKVFEKDTLLTFGKHRGFTIEDIFSMDYQYLIWMYENFEDNEWSNEVEKLVTLAYDKKSEEDRFYDSLDVEWASELGFDQSDYF